MAASDRIASSVLMGKNTRHVMVKQMIIEPEKTFRKQFLNQIGAKFSYCGGYFPLHCLRFCGLEDIPPGEFEPQCHEYRQGTPDTQPVQAETGFETRKGSFDTGPFGVGGAERGGLFLPEALGAAALSGSVAERAVVAFSGRGALYTARTGFAQRAVKDGARLPAGEVVDGFQRRMTCRAPTNAFGNGIDVKIVHMQHPIIAPGPDGF